MIGEALGAAGAAWLPLCLSFAALAASDRVRQVRRRRSLNARLHELRRPLQALALTLHPVSRGPDHLELALAALRDLDREVNGRPMELSRRRMDARAIATAAVERARVRAARSGRRLVLRWECAATVVSGDPRRLGQALDNLIDNALRHGRGTVTVRGSAHRGRLRVEVIDEGQAEARRPKRRDPRHGHGLRVAGGVATGHRGHLRLVRSEGGTVASLDLPLGV